MFIASSSAKDNGENKGADTGTDMYYVTACKVHGTDGSQESAGSPYHMSHRIVNDDGPKGDKNKQCFKFHTAYQRTGNKGRGDHGEHHLEHTKYQMWNGIRIRTHIHSNAV